MARLFCPVSLSSGLSIALPAGPARHAQVLRLQPGDAVTLFNGEGGEFDATITRMGRNEVLVDVGDHHDRDREIQRKVHLAVAMPANDRMDWLVEKATELGVASVQPLLSDRVILRLQGERAERKRSHWQAVAVAACEQCGRNRIPVIEPVKTPGEWLSDLQTTSLARLLLSLQEGAQPLRHAWPPLAQDCLIAVGPEGGWTRDEEALFRAQSFLPVTLGSAVLRAETAALAALAQA